MDDKAARAKRCFMARRPDALSKIAKAGVKGLPIGARDDARRLDARLKMLEIKRIFGGV